MCCLALPVKYCSVLKAACILQVKMCYGRSAVRFLDPIADSTQTVIILMMMILTVQARLHRAIHRISLQHTGIYRPIGISPDVSVTPIICMCE